MPQPKHSSASATTVVQRLLTRRLLDMQREADAEWRKERGQCVTQPPADHVVISVCMLICSGAVCLSGLYLAHLAGTVHSISPSCQRLRVKSG